MTEPKDASEVVAHAKFWLRETGRCVLSLSAFALLLLVQHYIELLLRITLADHPNVAMAFEIFFWMFFLTAEIALLCEAMFPFLYLLHRTYNRVRKMLAGGNDGR